MLHLIEKIVYSSFEKQQKYRKEDMRSLKTKYYPYPVVLNQITNTKKKYYALEVGMPDLYYFIISVSSPEERKKAYLSTLKWANKIIKKNRNIKIVQNKLATYSIILSSDIAKELRILFIEGFYIPAFQHSLSSYYKILSYEEFKQHQNRIELLDLDNISKINCEEGIK